VIRSTDRILTTHTGSLPRPADLIDLLWAANEGEPVDADEFAETARRVLEKNKELYKRLS
jgi:5-methyltetrahydropteroyltriglutamate--homocysteine methyltransferase